MEDDAEIRLLEARIRAIEARLDGLSQDSDGSTPTLLVQTAAEATYPSGAAVYAAHPVRVDFDQAEGAAFTLTPMPAVWVHYAHLGAGTPPEGKRLLLEAAGDRLVGFDA